MSRAKKLRMTDKEKERYEIVQKRRVYPTKFLDRATLEQLGMLDCTMLCLEHVGLGKFIDCYAPSYEDLCWQFLATFQCHMEDRVLQYLTFKYEKKEYSVTVPQMRSALGVTKPPSEDWKEGVSEGMLCDFWLAATGVPFNKGDEYNNNLTHPCLRLIHKVMMGTFLGHKEDNKVALKDLRWFFSVLSQAEIVPDWLTIFLGSLKRIRNGEKRDIVQGGLITLIAQKVIPVEDIEEPILSSVFDVNLLRKCNMMKVLKTKLFWCSYADKSHLLTLPRPLPYGPEFRDFFLPSDPTTPLSGSVAIEIIDSPPAPRRRRATAGSRSSQAPVDDMDEEMPAAGQGPPPMDPWQDMMYRQIQAMSLQQQQWQQGFQTQFQSFQQGFEDQFQSFQQGFEDQFQSFQSQMFGRMDSQDAQILELQRQQNEYFGRFPPPPEPPY